MPLHMIIPVGSGTAVGSGITTYSGLVTSAGLWLERSDLTTMIPDFISLVEERLSRILRVPEMEETTTLSTTSEEIHLPTDFRKARSLYLDTDPRQELECVSLGTLRTKYAQQVTGKPECYAISGSSIILGPAPDDTYDLMLTYYQDIPAISSDSETNWLITKHPSLYLYGVLMQAEFYGWNDERLPMIKAAWDEAIDELTEQGKGKQYGASPLRLRPSVRE
jgi:hypothetical protein